MYVYHKGQFSKNVFNYVEYNIGVLFSLAVIACILGFYTDKNYIGAIVTMSTATYVTWSGHYLLHNYNKYNPVAWIHKRTHHSPFADTYLGKLIEYLFIEFFFFGAGLLMILVLLLEKYANIKSFNPYVLLFWGISVPFIHEFHYHLLRMTNIHKVHHEKSDVNFSPDFWDVFMDKKEDNTHIENENLIVPSLLVVLMFILSIIGTKYDFIEYFLK
jgi:hypothetical protein